MGSIRLGGSEKNEFLEPTLGNDRIISAGISVGIMQLGVNTDLYIPPSTIPDPSLPSYKKQYSFLSNIGVVYKGNALSVGFSSTQFLSVEITSLNYSPARHYNLFASYDLLAGKKFVLKPQFMVRTDLVRSSADFNLLAKYNNRYRAGIYRTADAIGFTAGWDIKERYRIGYSYDHTINKLTMISRGTHEIVLGYLLK